MTTTQRLEERRPRRWGALLALVALGSLAGACDRAHLTPYYGRSFNAWFEMQHIRHEPSDSEATRRALASLDAQEAAAISNNYRRNVGNGESQQGQGQMVTVGQSHGNNEAYLPPPSVPGGQ